jgi:hypothetical protein
MNHAVRLTVYQPLPNFELNGYSDGSVNMLQIHPLLKELREAGVVGHVDALARLATETAADIRTLQSSVLDDDNVQVRRVSTHVCISS